jgi:hypothetical protein
MQRFLSLRIKSKDKNKTRHALKDISNSPRVHKSPVRPKWKIDPEDLQTYDAFCTVMRLVLSEEHNIPSTKNMVSQLRLLWMNISKEDKSMYKQLASVLRTGLKRILLFVING